MKILITGGSGFIGTHLIKNLTAQKYELINFDKENSGSFPELTIIGDVRNKHQLEQVLIDVDLVIHLAAEHKDNVLPKSLYYDVNVTGTQNLIDVCENNDIGRIVFTSTVAVYGMHLDESSEDSALRPFNDYGKSKLQAEQLLTDWYERGKHRSLSIIRPTVVFGEENRGNVYNLMKQVAENRFIMIGNGLNKKSIAYVGNLVNYISSSIKDTGFSITNYADKPDLSMQQLITAVNKYLGRKENNLYLPLWLGISVGYLFDLCSLLLKREFSISSIRIKKFCSNSTINTDRLDKIKVQTLTDLTSAVERTVQYEFIEHRES